MFIKSLTWDSNPVKHALNIAAKYQADAYTMEQRAWVIDQMTRALLDCPLIVNFVHTGRGEALEVEMQGESPEYLNFLAENPDWNQGVPP